jgi:hypothetical protein
LRDPPLELRELGVFREFQDDSCGRLSSMAQRVETTLVDDLDGVSLADETIRFGIDGSVYEIDLTAEHAAELRASLNAYVGVARRLSGKRLKAG